MSYVSNENVWKRIRTGLFDLTFGFSDFGDLCEIHPTRALEDVSDLGFGLSGRIFFGLGWTRALLIRVSWTQWTQWTQH